jgi:methyl-accepting chemotaxis protein
MISKLGKKILGIGIFICGIVAFILIGTYIYAFNDVNDKLRNDARKVALEAVKILDAGKFEKIVLEKDDESPEYKELLNTMLLFKAKSTTKNFYTYIKKDDKTVLFLLDASPEPAEFLEEYETYEEINEAFNGNVTVDRESTVDKWGATISAYAPIKNSAGKTIGVIGIDNDTTGYQELKELLFRMTIISLVVFFVLLFIVIILFSKKLNKNISILQSNLNQIENKDLSKDIVLKTNDEIEEIGVTINVFKKKINDILKLIRNSTTNVFEESVVLSNISSQISTSFHEVSSSIGQVTKGAEGQSEDLIRITNTLNEFSSELGEITNSIKDIEVSSNDISSMTNEGNINIQKLAQSVKSIEISFADFIAKIQGVAEEIKRVNDISETINSIAAQTNLLALNASIEAARAGEAGRGFAVVAEEIRKLAEQSKISSENINALISEVSEDTASMLSTADNMTGELSSQSSVINTTITSFKKITSAIDSVVPKIRLVDAASAKINAEKNYILESIENISAVSEEVSSSAEEILLSAEEVNSSAEEVSNTALLLNRMTTEMLEEINRYILQ